MIAMVRSGSVAGIDGFGVTVEIDIARGLPSFTIVGLPNAAVRESRERVTAAIRNNGYKLPQKRITVNLAPADVKKEGAAFDLPIAVGVLMADGQVSARAGSRVLMLGELALDGALKRTRGVLPIACFARDEGYGLIVVPEENGGEAAAVGDITVAPCRDLREAIRVVESGECPRRADGPPSAAGDQQTDLDYADVVGQEAAKRALQVAAAGGHHTIMVGPPGAGKTMLARRLPTILPPLDEEEALELAKIMSVAGGHDGAVMIRERPFRSPHHSASDAGLVGGGRHASPGEITLAHNGVLFLDELTEFRRNVLETLRQPLEEGRIVIARANAVFAYPARFQLVAAMNPCPCGWHGDGRRNCRCTPLQVMRYLSKVSGPLLDRISIHVPVRSVDPAIAGVMERGASTGSAALRGPVLNAVAAQRRRRAANGDPARNADLAVSQLEAACPMEERAVILLRQAQRRLGLSLRSRMNIVRVARTIADLDGGETILAAHVAEAVQYRVPAFRPE